MTALRDQFSSDKIDEVWNSANSLFKWRFRFVLIQKFGHHGNVIGLYPSVISRDQFRKEELEKAMQEAGMCS